MKVELICVGTELLLGNIVNTNAAFLSENCALLGLSCYYQEVVGDNEKRLEETLRSALTRSDIVILSGGLGPTKDDLTKETAAKVMGKELVMDEHTRELISGFFQKRGSEPTENNWKQAMVPENSIVLENENGTAPGIIMEDNGKRVILLPGPPNELIPLFEKSVKPYIRKLVPEVICSTMVKICNIGESRAETMVADMIEAQENPTLAPYAKTGEVHFRVTAKAQDEKSARKLIRPVVKELKKRFGDNVYTTSEDVTLEKALADLLRKHNLSVTTAESCTGGLIAARLVNVPGISDLFEAGFITYADKAKHKLLGVKKETLRGEGAVSEKTAAQMAKGAAKAAGAQAAIAVTGIAGPDGGTERKPVGLVYIGCYVQGKITVREYHFSGNRAKIRESTVSAALTQLRGCILKQCKKK